MTALLAALGVLVGLGGPRAPRAVLGFLAAAGLPIAGLALVSGSALPVVVVALLAALLVAGALLAPVALPRALLGVGGGVVCAGVVAGLVPTGSAPYVAVVVLVGSLLLAWRRPAVLLALACALGGGRLLGTALHAVTGPAVAVVVVALLAAQALLRRSRPEPPLRPGSVRRAAPVALVLGALAAVAVLLLPAVATPLPPPAEPVATTAPGGATLPPLPLAARRTAVEAAAPRGGLVWPLPSEALTWAGADRTLFPVVDASDARFLGAEGARLWKLPGTGPTGAFSLHPAVVRLRRTADEAALARLRAAARATALAFADVVPHLVAGTTEAEVARRVVEAMAARGCGPGSFPPVVASGAAAGAPHGNGNRGTLRDGTLVVVDMGCAVDGYVSDFTRTVPVGGRFTDRQRRLYQGVLDAQSAAVKACRPGVALGGRTAAGIRSLDALAREVLARTTDDRRAHMPHGLGHSVGLFVHDVPLGGPLARGNVVTLEPGTYLPGELGIRIEDTYLVTESGCEPLTAGFPAEVASVESALRRARAAD